MSLVFSHCRLQSSVVDLYNTHTHTHTPTDRQTDTQRDNSSSENTFDKLNLNLTELLRPFRKTTVASEDDSSPFCECKSPCELTVFTV